MVKIEDIPDAQISIVDTIMIVIVIIITLK